MATIEQLGQALKNADTAGDVAAARALAAEIQRVRGVATTQATPAAPPEPLSRMEKFGKGITDPISGAAQLLTNMLPQSVVNAGNAANNWLADKTGLVARLPEGGVDQQVREQEAAYEARRKAQGESGFDAYRMLGNVASPANLALAARIPAAATAAGRIGIGATSGALGGALSPVTEGNFGDEKLKQVGTGAAVGGALPVVTGSVKRLANVLRAGLIDPFTDAGRTKIVGSALNRAASNPAEAAGNMSMSSGATPGFAPTAAQSANDAGIASLERAARAIDPAGFGDIDQTQKAALVNALRSIAGTPEGRSSAEAAVNAQAKQLYGEAFKEQVPVTPELVRLMSRPSMRKAETRAKSLANELSIPFQATLDDMRPKYISMPGIGGTQTAVKEVTNIPQEFISLPPMMPTQSSFIKPGAPPDPYRTTPQRGPTEEIASGITPINWDFFVPGTGITKIEDRIIPDLKNPSWTLEVPPVESIPVRDAHTVKMAMDALLKDPTQGLAGREGAAIKATREKFLDMLPDSYQKARLAHIEANKPVNQMDIGQELLNRFVPPLSDGMSAPISTRAASLAQALRDGDKLAQNVTGMKGARFDKIMSPEQRALLSGVVEDSQNKAFAESAGRGVGSDTIQKMAMSNLIDQAGLPTWIGALGPLRSVGGMARTVGDIVYSKNDETMRHLLADVLKDPQRAAEAMRKANVPPSKYAEVLSRLNQMAPLPVASATVNDN